MIIYQFTSSLLDLDLTSNGNIIEDLQFGDKLGVSDRVSLNFNILYDAKIPETSKPRKNFHQGKCNEWNERLSTVKWAEMKNLDVYGSQSYS